MSGDDSPRAVLNRRLDLHHDAVLVGVVALCALCGASTTDTFRDDPRHDVQDDETGLARRYLVLFDLSGDPPGAA